MTTKEFDGLKRGDIVKHLIGTQSYMVDGHYGNFVIVVSTMTIYNPSEWDLRLKATYNQPDNKNHAKPT